MSEPAAEENGEADLRNIVFTKWVDQKIPKLGKNIRGQVRFFLVDGNNNNHLVAVADDSGDAHYTYHSLETVDKQLGPFRGKNRKDIVSWLEKLIRESHKRGPPSSPNDIAHLTDPTNPGNPFGLFFLKFRQERAHLPDGRRCNRWYLIDQHGTEHLAVVGEERDTRDGHYHYVTQEPFAQKYPLNCHNQQGVLHWIESMLTHCAPPGITIDFEDMRRNSGDLHPENIAAGLHSLPGGMLSPRQATGQQQQQTQAAEQLQAPQAGVDPGQPQLPSPTEQQPGSGRRPQRQAAVQARRIAIAAASSRSSDWVTPHTSTSKSAAQHQSHHKQAQQTMQQATSPQQPDLVMQITGNSQLAGQMLDLYQQTQQSSQPLPHLASGLQSVPDLQLPNASMSSAVPALSPGPEVEDSMYNNAGGASSFLAATPGGMEAETTTTYAGAASDTGMQAGGGGRFGMPSFMPPDLALAAQGFLSGVEGSQLGGQLMLDTSGGGGLLPPAQVQQQQAGRGRGRGRGSRGGGRGGAGSRPPSSGRASGGRQNRLSGGVAQDAHVKRLKRLAAEHEEAVKSAHAAHLVRMHKAAALELTEREAVRHSTASWVRGRASEEEQTVIEKWGGLLKELLQTANKEKLQSVPYKEVVKSGPLHGQTSQSQPSQPPNGDAGGASVQTAQTWTYSSPHTNEHGLRQVLECLREVGALWLPLQAFLSSGLVETVRGYLDHPHPSVQSLACEVLGRWQRGALARLAALTSTQLMDDPVATLERQVLAGEVTYPPLRQQAPLTSSSPALPRHHTPGSGEALLREAVSQVSAPATQPAGPGHTARASAAGLQTSGGLLGQPQLSHAGSGSGLQGQGPPALSLAALQGSTHAPATSGPVPMDM